MNRNRMNVAAFSGHCLQVLRRVLTASAGGMCCLGVGLWLSAVPVQAADASSSDKPERVELDTGSGKQVYHLLNGKRFLLISGDLQNAPRQIAVGIEIKVKHAAGGSLSVYGKQYEDVHWTLSPNLDLSARAGDNLWLGGMVQGPAASPEFVVQAWSVLPSDLQIWTERLKSLGEDALPEAAFDIAVRLQISLQLALEATAEEVDHYREAIRQSCLEGVRRDMLRWKTESVDERAARYAKAVERWKTVAEKMPSDLVDWLSMQYETLLTQKDKWTPQRFQAEAALQIGAFVEKFQPDIEQRTEELKNWYTQVSDTLKNHEAVQGVMQKLGYEWAGGAWVKSGSVASSGATDTQQPPTASAAADTGEAAAPSNVSQASRMQAAMKQMQRQQRLLAGEGSLKAELMFDEILREQDDEEMERQIRDENIPEDACRYALQAAVTALSEPKRLRFYAAALESPQEGVQRDAMERLALIATKPSVDILAGFLTRTENPLLRRETLVTLRSLPQKQSVQALIWLAGSVGLPAPIKASAISALKQSTKQDFGNDTAAWQQWWQQSGLKEVSKTP